MPRGTPAALLGSLCSQCWVGLSALVVVGGVYVVDVSRGQLALVALSPLTTARRWGDINQDCCCSSRFVPSFNLYCFVFCTARLFWGARMTSSDRARPYATETSAVLVRCDAAHVNRNPLFLSFASSFFLLSVDRSSPSYWCLVSLFCLECRPSSLRPRIFELTIGDFSCRITRRSRSRPGSSA